MMKTFPSKFSFTPLNVSFWVVADGVCCWDHLGLDFPLLLEVDGALDKLVSAEIDPVGAVPSPLELRSTLVRISPILSIVSGDNCIIQKMKNIKIYQLQVCGGKNIIRIGLRVY